jgi:lysine-specific demethylase 8
MHHAPAPSIDEIIALTRTQLTVSRDDAIRSCGPAALALLPNNPDAALQLAYQKLHDVPYKDVKTCWRRLYTEAALWKVLRILESRTNSGLAEETAKPSCEDEQDNDDNVEKQGLDWMTQVVKTLDMALILTGAPKREELVELLFSALEDELEKTSRECVSFEPPQKRRKLETNDKPSQQSSQIPDTFPSTINLPPELRIAIPRFTAPSLEAFQKRIARPETQIPIIIEGAIDFWPALGERSWNKPSYLLSHTLGGRRLVPVEIGRSYTDESWGQKILSFREFMGTFMFKSPSPILETNKSTNGSAEKSPTTDQLPQTGYLAQHDLFAQIPSLRADISIPDYCYSDPPLSTPSNVKPLPKLEDPLLNAWFGPAGTISPLHTDPYHNILAQLVGYKYIRLYAPNQTEKLHPRGIDENGIDMSNTSQVDLNEAFSLVPELSPWSNREGRAGEETDADGVSKKEFEERFPEFRDAEYVEGVLGPGDLLYIPVGWWHYVTSLTPSFSVSFWFN